MLCVNRFNSRTPCGVRPSSLLETTTMCRFQFTHPVRGATYLILLYSMWKVVSIHAPRAGCDFQAYRRQSSAPSVSIHAPRAGCDYSLKLITSRTRCFNSRTPCGVRHIQLYHITVLCGFNSRTPCGVRLHSYIISYATKMFQFTHPVRGATASGAPLHLF